MAAHFSVSPRLSGPGDDLFVSINRGEFGSEEVSSWRLRACSNIAMIRDRSRATRGKILASWFLVAGFVFPATAAAQNHLADLDPKISKFEVNRVPAIQALLQLSRTEHVAMGIVEGDDALCKSVVKYSAENVGASTIIARIIAQVPGYVWRQPRESSVFHIAPASLPEGSGRFLYLKIPRFGPARYNLQTLDAMLWMHIRYVLDPDQGTAGSILSSTNAKLYEIEAKDVTVEALLDRLAVLTKGTWVVRTLPPTLKRLDANIPFSVFSEDGQSSEAASNCIPASAAAR